MVVMLTARSSRTSLGHIEEDHCPMMDFKELNTKLTASELDRYKVRYFESDSIYQRVLPECGCDLCQPLHYESDPMVLGDVLSLHSSKSLAIAIDTRPSLKRTKTPYNVNGSKDKLFMFRQNSFSLHYSHSDIVHSADRDRLKIHEDQSLYFKGCEKEKSLPLIQVMGIGLKNKKRNFMHTLNDINSRMVFMHKFNLKPSSMDHPAVYDRPQWGPSKTVPINIGKKVGSPRKNDDEEMVKRNRFKHQWEHRQFVVGVQILPWPSGS